MSQSYKVTFLKLSEAYPEKKDELLLENVKSVSYKEQNGYLTLEKSYGNFCKKYESNSDGGEMKSVIGGVQRTPYEVDKGVQKSRTYFDISEEEYCSEMKDYTGMKNPYDIAGQNLNYYRRAW